MKTADKRDAQEVQLIKNKGLRNKTVSPAEMINLAISGGADLDKLEKLLIIQERWEANEARKAYHKSMAEFKANPPTIHKNKKVNYQTSKGNTSYSHADLNNVVELITPALSRHNLSASWKTSQSGDLVTVTCKITHILGHSEDTPLTAKGDDSGSKNSIQALGSTITYLERYTLLAATGLATKDQDTDGKKPVPKMPDAKLHMIRDLLLVKEMPESKLLEFLKTDSLEEMPESRYMEAIQVINAAKKVVRAPEAKK